MSEHKTGSSNVAAMTLGALGVVFGDIGTSPLYTLHECTNGEGGAASENVLGVLSLIFWALMMVVTIKYLTFIMRADNRGEGGILALLALIPQKMREPGSARVGLIALLVIAGAALLYGDGVITPALSVLSAIEGINMNDDETMKRLVVPITCAILVGLFAIQSRGTGTVGKLFGPIMLIWFVTIGALGITHIAKHPDVLRALSPVYGVHYFRQHGMPGFPILGAVVLAVTGGEALYADMGHFGAKPIRVAWLALVMPALVLAYFGQGALLLADPTQQKNPFFAMVPDGPARIALVALAAAATIIASQALISGAFSLTHQAVQLGFFPRVTVTHTSRESEGQIYVPQVNWGLAIGCLILVVTFEKSEKLAAAYGIAVSGTMAITSIVYYVVTRRRWGWPIYKALPLLLLFLAFDLPFFAANLFKFMQGGFVPILIGAAILIVMVVWKIGRSVLYDAIIAKAPPLESFIEELVEKKVTRIPGTAIFLASASRGVPPVMAHHVSRIKVLAETVALLTIEFDHVPFVDKAERFKCETLAHGFTRVIAHYGYMERPDVPELLRDAKERHALPIDLDDATYFLGRETFLATKAGRMGPWSESIFAFLSRNAKSATSYFAIPPHQVVELGTQIDL